MTAKAAVFHGPRDVRVEQMQVPDPGPGDCIVRVVAAGVDGSDLKMVNGELEAFNRLAPIVLGDEIVGEVVALGPGTAEARGINTGDLVVVEGRWSCYECLPCRRGNYYTCAKGWAGNAYGWTPIAHEPGLWGSYSTHVFVPARAQLHKVPQELSVESALVGASVFANGVEWTRRAGVQLGDTVVVVGPGPQGIALVLAAHLAGAEVGVIGAPADGTRLKLAMEMGATRSLNVAQASNVQDEVLSWFGGAYPDHVFDAAGSQAAFDTALGLSRPSSSIRRVALGPSSGIQMPTNEMLLREVSLSVLLAHPHAVQRSLTVASRLEGTERELSRFVTHSFDLEDVVEAIRCAAYETEARPMKVVLRP